jgi:hypothetical protein
MSSTKLTPKFEKDISSACPESPMPPLKILLGNNTLRLLAGTETWTCTLALELKRLGHHVECFSPLHGPISERLTEQGFICHQQFGFRRRLLSRIVPDRTYDIIIANHKHIVESLRRTFPKTPIISTIHGIIHRRKDEKGVEKIAPEHPALKANVGQFVSVSEEVRDVLMRDYSISSVIVRNFFDFEQMKTNRPVSPRPKRLVFNSNYNKPDSVEVQIIREVARHYGAEFVPVGLNHSTVLEMKELIERSDIVVGLGRSVLEGVALGRLGLVHGHWGTGGVVCSQTVESLRQCNFSGRNAKGRMMAPDEIIQQIDRHYNAGNLGWGVEYVRREHNVVSAAARYVQLARDLIASRVWA